MQCQVSQVSRYGNLIHHFLPSRIELYGAEDKGQKDNLVRRGMWPDPQQMTSMVDHLNTAWRKYRTLDSNRMTVEMDQATRDRLNALGYGD